MKVVKIAALHGLAFKILVQKCSFYYIKSLIPEENPQPWDFKVGNLRFKCIKCLNFIIHAPKEVQNIQEMPKNPKFRIYFKYPS